LTCHADGLLDRTLSIYEAIGDGVIRTLAQESRIPDLQPLLDTGRREHRRITRETFQPRSRHWTPLAQRSCLTCSSCKDETMTLEKKFSA